MPAHPRRAIVDPPPQPGHDPAATTPNAPALRTVRLRKVYGSGEGSVVAVDGVELALEPATFTAIMGPSGSGKSTLMHCMAGLDRATSGQIFLGTDELSSMPEKELTKLRRDKVGFVFQSFNLLPTLTAEQNILLPLDLAGRRVDRALFDQVVSSLRLTDRLTHRPSELSGGQQQRVAIARALITRPQVLFADEPTGALDSRTGAELLAYLQHSVRDLSQTIVMVTHDPNAAVHADRVLILSDGHIVSDLPHPDTDAVLAAMKGLGA